ncbi:MAG: hypothetical protein F4Y90_08395 [Rhodothermaceae bacterium]|nr:hypothetical protein [Rhodothermaceae bacterium]
MKSLLLGLAVSDVLSSEDILCMLTVQQRRTETWPRCGRWEDLNPKSLDEVGFQAVHKSWV